jgi:hypothetical protein
LIQSSNDRLSVALINSERSIREDGSKRKAKLEASLAISTPAQAEGIKKQLDVIDTETELSIKLMRDSAEKTRIITGLDKVGVTGTSGGKPSADGFGDMTVSPSK